jgi:rare lipoprotein A
MSAVPAPRLARALVVLALLALAACSSAPKKPGAGAASGKPVAGTKAGSTALPSACTGKSPYAAAQEDPSTRGDYTAGGLYKPGVNDSTPDHVPDVACIPEPRVVDEPRSALGNRSPYVVLGKKYYVMDRPRGYVEKGTASYYGAKFHGRRTSNQEVYDMYAFTAAHKTLPLPSFARVTNLDNGESVVVRVNDRGPFHDGRVIDLSYAAAVKLGIVARGTGRVEVRALQPGDEDSRPRVAAAARPPAAPVRTVATTAPAMPATGMDQLVQALPSTTGPAASAPVSVVPVATTIPAPAVATTVAGVAASMLPPSGPLRDGSGQSGTYAPIGSAPPPASPGTELQVASFSSLDNARRALDRLLAAGIAGARLDDVVAGGRTLWRLRVAPGATDAAELAGRIAGLGFGTPQLVRE